MRRWRQAVAASIIIVCGWLAWAAATSAVMAQADEGYRHFLLQLWPDAERMGVTRATFDRALLGVEPDRSLPDLVLPGQEVKGQPEFTRTPAQYLDADYLARLSEQGKALLKLNAAALAKIEQARKLYARYRTDDVLDRLKNEASDKNGKPQPWE